MLRILLTMTALFTSLMSCGGAPLTPPAAGRSCSLVEQPACQDGTHALLCENSFWKPKECSGGCTSAGGRVSCAELEAGSCTSLLGETHYCIDYAGSTFTPSALRMECTAEESASYSSSRCNASALGICTMNPGTTTEYKMVFYRLPSHTTPKSFCETIGGNFSAN